MFKIQPHLSRTLSWWNGQRKHIDMNPSYQRKGNIWSDEDKSYLVDSILNDYDVPKLYLADFTYGNTSLNEKGRSYAVIDGKQRLEAIFDFFDGTLVLDERFSYEPNRKLKLTGLTFKDLKSRHPEVASAFENFNLSVMSVITDEEGKINDLFVRLNRSKPLTGSEIRSAMLGVVPRLIDAIARHKFFRKCIRFTTKRKQEFNAAAKILLIEFRGKFVDTKRTHLDRFVQEGLKSQTTTFDRAAERVKEVLDDMASVFAPKDLLLSSQGPITLYYWFVKRHTDSREAIREFLVAFDAQRKENRKRVQEGKKADEELLRFDLLSRSINDQGSLTERFAILENRFQAFLHQ
jgi:Protein of unknown function DUF262